MKKISMSKILATLSIGVFIGAVILRFITVQNLDTSEENFHLYHMGGDKLFSISNENNKTLVTIYDESRVHMDKNALYNRRGNTYQVLPYSSITISDSNGSKKSLTYRFMADSSKKGFSYPINRWHTYEIIGGVEKNPNPNYRQQHLARLYPGDEPLLAIFPQQKGKKLFRKDNNELYVVALQDNLVYVDKNGTEHKLVPVEKKELNHISLNRLQKIEKGGFIRSTGNSATVVLDIALKDGTRSIQLKKSKKYVQEKTKYLTITEYSDFQNIDRLVLAHASKDFYVKKDRYTLEDIRKAPKIYLDAPYEIPVGNRITIKGREALFSVGKYASNADFAKEVPRLDKPVKEKKELEKRNSRYTALLDIDNMFGLYVSDEKAKIFYSTDKQEWLEVEKNYKYAPPLYLYDPKVKGQFVAPELLADYEKPIFYKIISTKKAYTIAFQGNVKVFDTKGKLLSQGTYKHNEEVKLTKQEVILETLKMPLPSCGQILPLFDTDKENLTYRFRDGTRRDFDVVKVGDKYDYRIKERLSPFKTHKVTVMKGANVYKRFEKFKPQLSCKYKLRKTKEKIPSLYAKENMLKLVQNPQRRKGVTTAMDQSTRNATARSKKKVDVPRELIPIYGDGEKFGLLSHGLTKDELTIDQNFSMKVAEIFEEEANKALSNKALMAKLKNYQDVFIEGATVVLKINKNKEREVLAMFSYPYPETNDTQRELIVDALNNKYSTVKNRALDMLAAPGSTFKIVTSLALAANNMLVDIPEIYQKDNLEDVLFQGRKDSKIGFSLKNSSKHWSKDVDFKHAFAESFNTYFGYAGLMLHRKIMQKYSKDLLPVLLREQDKEAEFDLVRVAKQLYFNKTIELSHAHKIKAAKSVFPTTFTRAKEVADSAIGQYEVRATPLQMAMVTSVVYDGKLILPKIVKSEKSTVVPIDGMLSSQNLKTIQDAMEDVVRKIYGTADREFRSFFKSYRSSVKIYAKTGTSQTAKKGIYDGWFVTFTKGLKEDLVIATVLRNSGYGSKYAAPINRKIIEAWIAKTEPALKNKKR